MSDFFRIRPITLKELSNRPDRNFRLRKPEENEEIAKRVESYRISYAKGGKILWWPKRGQDDLK